MDLLPPPALGLTPRQPRDSISEGKYGEDGSFEGKGRKGGVKALVK